MVVLKDTKATRTLNATSDYESRAMHNELCTAGYHCYASEFVRGVDCDYVISHYRCHTMAALRNNGDRFVDIILERVKNRRYAYGFGV